jgi:hypothetical protein
MTGISSARLDTTPKTEGKHPASTVSQNVPQSRDIGENSTRDKNSGETALQPLLAAIAKSLGQSLMQLIVSWEVEVACLGRNKTIPPQLNVTVGPLDRGILYGRMSVLCGPTVTFNQGGRFKDFV